MGSIDQEPQPERILKTDLREYSNRTRHDGPYADDLDLDVLIVGAGKLLSSDLPSKFVLLAMPLRGQYGVRTWIARTRSFDRSLTTFKALVALSACMR
jgi:hypothetical protein